MTPGRLLAALALAGLASCAETRASRPVVPPPTAAPASEAVVPPMREDGRLPRGVVPLRYELALRVDPAQPTFSGTARISVALAAETRAIVLHGRHLLGTTATATSGGATLPAEVRARPAAGGKGDPEELVLVFARALPPGEAVLDFSWEAPFDEALQGLYHVVDGGRPYAFTQLEPTDARRMFPCFDEPGFKTPFAIALTVPNGMLALTNAPETGRTEDGPWTTFRFAPTTPLPTYLVALAVGALDVREGAATPTAIRLVTTHGKSPGGTFALEATQSLLVEFERFFGRRYPFAKLDMVAVPEFGAGAMENAGFVTFREELLLLDEKRATASEKRRAGTVIAHELAHQWFGDLVTSAWWDDLWLNEGFATWLQTKVVAAWRPELRPAVDAQAEKLAAMELDVLPGARAVRQPVTSTSEALEAFDGVTYDKGAAVLRMLEGFLGEAAFRDGVRAHIAAHEHGSATAAELLQTLAKISGKDVPAIAHGFLDQPGVPLVSAEVRCDGGNPRIVLAQKPLRARAGAPANGASWNVPVCIAYGSPRAEACFVLESASREVPLAGGCPTWVVANAHESGYYRAAPLRGKALVSALPHLEPLERAALVANAGASVAAGETPVVDLVAVLRALRGERDRSPLLAMVEALTTLRERVADAADVPAVAKLTREVLGPSLARLGWSPDDEESAACPRCATDASDEATATRELLLLALARVGDDEGVLAAAKGRAAIVLAGSPRVSSENAALALRIAAIRGDAAFLDALEKRAAAATTPGERLAAITAMAAITEPTLVRRVLDRSLTDAIKIHDLRYVYGPAFEGRATQAVGFAWLQQRWDAAKRRIPPWQLTRFIALVGSACTPGERDERSAFLQTRTADVEGAERELSLALARAEGCIELRAREALGLHRALTR